MKDRKIYSNRMIQTVSSNWHIYQYFPNPDVEWGYKELKDDIDKSTFLKCVQRNWIEDITKKPPKTWKTSKELWSAIKSTRKKRENES